MPHLTAVDGLRGLAILLVLFFHAKVPGFEGGFLGVDLFLVLSGYLIASIVSHEMDAGQFSLTSFYERRARRIAPALLAMLVAVGVVSFFMMTPLEMASFTASAAAAAAFVSNIYFWKHSNYFESVETSPILHTWSLGVEIQFYLIFPLLLWLTRRSRWLIQLHLLMLALTLALHHVGFERSWNFAFYMLPTRLYEFEMGVLACLLQRAYPGAANNPRWAGWLGGLGLAVVLTVGVFYQRGVWPHSAYTLLLTTGSAVLLFFARAESAVNSALSVPPLRFVGLISYSLYVWHQPIFTLYRQWELFQPLSGATVVALLIASFVVAWFSYRFIEKPFRDRRAVSLRTFLVFGLGSGIALGAHAMAQHQSNGFFLRGQLHGQFDQEAVARGPQAEVPEACQPVAVAAPGGTACATSGTPSVVMWGDSYAKYFVSALMASKPDAPMALFEKAACGPFIDVVVNYRVVGGDFHRSCIEFNDQVLSYLKSKPSVTHVVLVTRFAKYLDGDMGLVSRTMARQGSTAEHALPYFLKTLQAIRAMGKVPLVVEPAPEDGVDRGACFYKAKLFNRSPEVCNTQRSHPAAVALAGLYKPFFAEVAALAPVVDMGDVLCDQRSCRVYEGDLLLFRDFGHFNVPGARLVGQKMDLYSVITRAKLP